MSKTFLKIKTLALLYILGGREGWGGLWAGCGESEGLGISDSDSLIGAYNCCVFTSLNYMY